MVVIIFFLSQNSQYPEEAVAMQQRIINRVESDLHYKALLEQNAPKPHNTPTDAIIAAARQIATTINAKSIVCFSLRGSTVLRAAKGRPGVPILAMSPFKETSRQLVMSWGVYPGTLIETITYSYTLLHVRSDNHHHYFYISCILYL